ncbi:MAG: D-alanyl-D-alanine carboxypeptidase DacB precursor [Pseudomonadota bacterium]|jgi:D-alanyl-D-alanine carboxypeptidase/D-alanyl-D-alanine-endopeptidase (penicillin-binding protein 4)
MLRFFFMRLRPLMTPLLALSLTLQLGSALGAAAKPAAQSLPPSVSQALRQVGIPPAAMAVEVMPLAPDGLPVPLLSREARTPVNPASLMKLVTTYAGLDLLGPQFTWDTRIWTTGEVRAGTLHGDLIIEGSGDPKWVRERMEDTFAAIKSQGIERIDGHIVLDRSVMNVTPRSEAFDDEPLRPYNVEPDGLLVNFKALIFKFTPDPVSNVARIDTEPYIDGVSLPTQVPLSSTACQDWRSQLRADFSNPLQIRFTGAYPLACGAQEWPVAYSDPTQYARRVVRGMWLAAGGQLSGQVREGQRPGSARLLLHSPSLPLSELVADINKFSNNVMAQQLFLTLSVQPGVAGSFEQSRQRVGQWWRARLPLYTAPTLDNGSGLSRQERIEVRSLSALLQLAAQGPLAQTFQHSLSIVGVDGTVKHWMERYPHSQLQGKAWLKTGSLRDVAAVAGYVQSQTGQRYSVVAIVNHEDAKRARPALSALLEWVENDAPPPSKPSGRRQAKH